MSAIICSCMVFNISWVRNYLSAPKKPGFAQAFYALSILMNIFYLFILKTVCAVQFKDIFHRDQLPWTEI